MKVFEIIFDLTNPNQKPMINVFDIKKETEKYVHCTPENGYGNGRLFYKPNMNVPKYSRIMIFKYSFISLIDDYDSVIRSALMESVIDDMKNALQREISYYQAQLNGVVDYYIKSEQRDSHE